MIVPATLMAMSLASIVMQTEVSSPQHRRPLLIEQLARVNDLYKGASTAKARECDVRAFVDAEFEQYPFRAVNDGIKRRIVKTQLQFGQNKEAFITELKVSDALNNLGQDFNFPSFAEVNVRQLRLCRMFLLRHAPAVIGGTSKDLTIPATMSPGESILLIQFVTTQKLINPAFQVSADVWSEGVLRRAHSRSTKSPESHTFDPTPRLEMEPSNLRMIQIADSVSAQLAHPDTKVSLAFESLLDQLRFLK